ncbi:hypothetical protein, conserved [Eimeria acervulina]|uniref:Uncharacterized protein n=1 Tax=Eimeria acervulina TaxID=5801 RepID=U6GR24_EIMAC|nr:hypothetical protein, conserved [Eimeria acervulina]CDI82701.1 hypothetical protein, conserved [Eimeria acervulina]
MQAPKPFDVGAGQLMHLPHEDAAGDVAPTSCVWVYEELQKLQEKMCQMRRQLDPLEQKVQSRLWNRQYHLAPHNDVNQHQRRSHWQPHNWQQGNDHMQQPRHQHRLQQQMHQQARAREEQQVTLEEKSGQQHDPTRGQRKRKREQQEGAELLGEPQSQRLKPAESVSAPMVEDAWLTHGPPRLQTPQPSTSQQALQSTAAAVPAGPSTPEDIGIQAIPGFSQPHHPPSHSAAVASASGYDADAPGTSEDGGPAAALYRRNADPGSSVFAGARRAEEMPLLTALVTSNSASVEAISAGAGSIVVASASTSTVTELMEKADSPPPPRKEHPFVHLPTLEVTVPPVFCSVDVKRAVSTYCGKRNPVPLLRKARRLLVQPCLGLAQIMELVGTVEDLITHAVSYAHHRCDVTKMIASRAAERLAFRFLILETVVSTLIVLHQTPDPSAWKQLTDAISHAVPTPTPRAYFAGRNRFFTTLAADLSSAIQILKTGRRPDPEDLLDIKLKLFCHKYSPPRLKEGDFDEWRADNESFTAHA